MSYVLSNDNRFYVALEPSYGVVPAISAGNRIPALRLTMKQRTEKAQRRDKTGSRTFTGNPSGVRRLTSFELKSYMTTWNDQTQPPPHGPLFQACLGSAPMQFQGGTVLSSAGPSQISFTGPHGLGPGQAVTSGGEIRFVSAVVNAQTIQLNAPFSVSPVANSQMGPTAVYQPTANLPSVTLFDYWSPATSVQRILAGTAIDTLTLSVNGDFHEFNFSGPAQDVLDSSSFESGQAGLSSYPLEPSVGPMNYAIIPGHMGQVWLGSTPERFWTLTKANVSFANNVELRAREFGEQLPSAIAPGQRTVSISLSLYQQDDAATAALYQSARQRSPIGVMIQLGQQQGQLLGIYMQNVIAEVPGFDDSETRQQWQFQGCRAQGGVDDEVVFAFG